MFIHGKYYSVNFISHMKYFFVVFEYFILYPLSRKTFIIFLIVFSEHSNFEANSLGEERLFFWINSKI